MTGPVKRGEDSLSQFATHRTDADLCVTHGGFHMSRDSQGDDSAQKKNPREDDSSNDDLSRHDD